MNSQIQGKMNLYCDIVNSWENNSGDPPTEKQKENTARILQEVITLLVCENIKTETEVIKCTN